MEAAPQHAAVLTFMDGPAEGERVHINVPPQQSRWYCQHPELGSEDLHGWWALEEPPPDDTLTVTRYDLHVGEPEEEDGAALYRYSVALETHPLGEGGQQGDPLAGLGPEDRERLERLSAVMAPQASIPVARFRDADVSAVLIGNNWHAVSYPGEMSEIVIETDGEANLSIGPCFCVETLDGRLLVPPHAVQAFRVGDSTVALDPEERLDGSTVFLNRISYGADEGKVAHADRVVVIEPNGRETVVKSRDGAAD